jgi:hypothetical protein
MTRILGVVLLAFGLVAGAHAAGSGSVNGSVLVNPLAVSLALSSGSSTVGSPVTATATARNAGPVPLSVTVTLTADVNLAVADGVTRTIGTLPANGTAQVSWPLCALAPGGYVVLANATSGPFRTDSQAQVLNVSAGSGLCPKDVTGTLLPGGTLSTDREGDGATPASPVETAVTAPSGGAVSIAQTTASFVPTAFTFLGQQVQISAPTATAALPLRIAFRLDFSLGTDPGTLEIFRNGIALPTCSGANAGATPDPCISSRITLPDGDVELVVLTSAASTWTFGKPIIQRGGIAAALTTSNRHLVGLLAASDGSKLAGVLTFDTFQSKKATALAVSGRKAWYAGLGTDGRPFAVYMEDNGRNGRGDVFKLWIGGVEQTSDGKLAKGDVAVTS